MKIAIISDTHAGVRNGSGILIDYQRRFYEEVFFPYLKEHGIRKIIHLGDYYDNRKYIGFRPLEANRKMFLEPLGKHGIHMDIIPGNHDVAYKNTNDLCSLTELMASFRENVNIITEPTVMDYDGTAIALLPWINSENYDDTMAFLERCPADIVGAHLELAGFEMMRGITSRHGMDASLFSRFGQVWTGHFHTKSTMGNITYLGAQMEFTWADCEDPKYFHVFDTATGELTPVQNPLTLFAKLYYNDDEVNYASYDISGLKNHFVKLVVAKKGDPAKFEKFVARLQEGDIHELKIAETFEEFTGENVDVGDVAVEDTAEIVDSYVDAVEDTELDKDRLKLLMRKVLVEAQNSEIV